MLWSALTTPFVKIDAKAGLVEYDLENMTKVAEGAGKDHVDLGPGRSMRNVLFNQTPLELACPLYTLQAARTFKVPEQFKKPVFCFNPRCSHHTVAAAQGVKEWLHCPQCKTTHFCSHKCRANTLPMHQEKCTRFSLDMVGLYYRLLRAAEARFESKEDVGSRPSPSLLKEPTLRWPVPLSLTGVLEPVELIGLVQRFIVYVRQAPEWQEAMASCRHLDDMRCFVCGRKCKFDKMFCGAQVFGVTPANAVVGWAFITCSEGCAQEPSPGNPFVPHISFEVSITPLKNGQGEEGYAACLGARFEPGLAGNVVFADDLHKMTAAPAKGKK